MQTPKLKACDRVHLVHQQLRDWMAERKVPRRIARLAEDAILTAAAELHTADQILADWIRASAQRHLEKALTRIAQLARDGHLSSGEHAWMKSEIDFALESMKPPWMRREVEPPNSDGGSMN